MREKKKQRTTATKITTGRTVMAKRLDSSHQNEEEPVLPAEIGEIESGARPSRTKVNHQKRKIKVPR